MKSLRKQMQKEKCRSSAAACVRISTISSNAGQRVFEVKRTARILRMVCNAVLFFPSLFCSGVPSGRGVRRARGRARGRQDQQKIRRTLRLHHPGGGGPAKGRLRQGMSTVPAKTPVRLVTRKPFFLMTGVAVWRIFECMHDEIYVHIYRRWVPRFLSTFLWGIPGSRVGKPVLSGWPLLRNLRLPIHCPTVPYPTYTNLPYTNLPYPALSFPTLSHPTLPYPTLP